MNNAIKRTSAALLSVLLLSAGAVSASADTTGSIDIGSVGINAQAVKPKKIKLKVTNKTIYAGQKYTLKVKSIAPKNADTKLVWKSSVPSVASVNENGVITGKKSGTTVITVMSKYDKKVKAACKVTVKDYGKRNVKYSSAAVVYEVPNDTYADLNKLTVVSSVKERNKLIWYIRDNYPDTDRFYKRSQVIKQLKKYDEEFFKNNTLIYTMSVTEGLSPRYVNAETYGCVKKFSGGKLTAYVKTRYSEHVPDDVLVDTAVHTRFNCYFTAVSKASVKNVKAFKRIEK